MKQRKLAKSSKPKAILIVSGDEFMLNIIASVVRARTEYEVFQALSDKYARNLLRKNDIQVLLIDSSEPEMGYLQMAFWYHANHPQVKIIVASDTNWAAKPPMPLSDKITFIVRPFSMQKLINLLNGLKPMPAGLS